MKFGDKCQYRTYSDMLHGWTVRGDVRYGRVSWQYWTYHAPRLVFQERRGTRYKKVTVQDVLWHVVWLKIYVRYGRVRYQSWAFISCRTTWLSGMVQ